MTKTGWMGEEPEPAAPAMPVTDLLLSGSRGQQGDVLGIALARAAADDAREERERAATAFDPDEYAAGFVARGYTPGLLGDLAQRLGDTQAELEDEREKIEKGRRRQEQVMRRHAAGQVSVADIARMDFDEGDEGKVEKLERRAASLRRQIEDASALAAPQAQRAQNPVQQAVDEARQLLAEAGIGAVPRAVRAAEHALQARRLADEAAARDRAQLAAERKGFRAGFGARSR